ncbi:hypothetical protein ACEPRD_23530 [Escherichia coli]|uniref:hypothetical protein n=1 Tax=Escherichia coli TaxID=562 RepID=UPI001D670B57|nr:hypothetical protein [Escherichia coli]
MAYSPPLVSGLAGPASLGDAGDGSAGRMTFCGSALAGAELGAIEPSASAPEPGTGCGAPAPSDRPAAPSIPGTAIAERMPAPRVTPDAI